MSDPMENFGLSVANQTDAEERGYRRGFIQGIQFVLRSYDSGGNSIQEVMDAQVKLHVDWRCETALSNRTTAPGLVNEVQPFMAAVRRRNQTAAQPQKEK